MSSSPSSWEHLQNLSESQPSEACLQIQNQALQILAGAPLSDELQQHRESCLLCIRFLKDQLLDLKNELPAKANSVMIKCDQLSYAAGTTEGLRSLSSSELSKVGLSSGWHIDIQPIDSEQLKICIISDLPKNIHMTLLNSKGQKLATLKLSQLPVYLEQKTALLVDEIILKEMA